MIWDAFLFFNELDMLECRLVELGDVVDRFILVDASVNFVGEPKPSYYLENQDRFSRWNDRITHVWVDDLSECQPARREPAMREAIAWGLQDASDNDVFLLSDVDEIPNPEIIPMLEPAGYVSLSQRFFSWAVDWEMPIPWNGTMAAPVGLARRGFQRMRDLRNRAPMMPDGGWHLSWVGAKEFCLEKAKTQAAADESVVEEVLAGVESGAYLRDGETISVFGPGTRMRPVDVDDSWPRYIAERRCPENWFRPR